MMLGPATAVKLAVSCMTGDHSSLAKIGHEGVRKIHKFCDI
jgi:hypothetical protein